MQTNIGLSETSRKAVSEQLAKLLADEFILYTKTRNAHWNIEGPDFHTAHLFFESQYQLLDEIVDNVAERIRKLGHYAPATLTQFLQLTHLTEKLDGGNDSPSYMRELLLDHESIIKFLRANIAPSSDKFHDDASGDYFTQLLAAHEEMAWKLRSHFGRTAV